tara:strand:- start:320 stop:4801 length:4482 start_codon:yes stop_codon:yes gene_type:complete
MSDNIRIKTTPGAGSKNINIKINQKFDFIEILSLKISQDEVYRRFCSDYGVVVGRIIVNNGVGVPNAKVSIFIPIDEIDSENSEIFGLYPYETITDTNDKGVPYNLLPRNNRGKDECFSPVGTFPSKREIQDNPEMGSIYCDYYKFTVTTNESGDFMIFGVPVGTHFMHVNADISDIGALSQRPYDLIREGVPIGKFRSTTKFRGREENPIHQFYKNNQLKTHSPISVTVPPFWGDTEECRIGIARTDIDLATNIQPQAIFMGSIISDNDKHALSKICVPRRKLGKMDEIVTGEGRIEMIRKNNNDKIERFDVEGGDVIDSDGAWAYQIPMDRDYMVTDEYGDFIPSEDQSKGIATKAKVRFRIGMNIGGDEGKNRTRAKFLVPHNPDTWKGANEVGIPGTEGYVPLKKGVDFSFDSSTKDEHFTELSWNKIYTVKNHITRTQPYGYGAENRNFIGLKNVDDSKNRNPFPFNKMDNKPNQLFILLCIIIRIIARVVGVINVIIISIINLIIMLMNTFMRAICIMLYGINSLVCGLKFAYNKSSCREGGCIGEFESSGNKCNCKDIFPYVPYITLGCSADDSEKKYAPGGRRGKTSENVYRKAFDATRDSVDPDTKEVITQDFHYVNDGAPEHECTAYKFLTVEGCDAGWSHCQTLALADAMDIFKFDFYNDWVNGSLYSFLLKYKIKKRGAGAERFCEVDCRQLDGGVDNNDNGIGDNRCRRNFVLDTCTAAPPQNSTSNPPTYDAVNTFEKIKFRSGYVKKYEDELYYSPMTKDGDIRLYATDIVNLGSVFECDWEGEPSLYKYLTDTTFNIPPLVAQYEPTETGGNGPIETTGFDTPLGLRYSFITLPPNGIYNVSTPNRIEFPLTSAGIFKGGLIGNITCIGFTTNGKNCNNIKRLSELGMGLDERRDDSTPNNLIGNEDVESDFVRGIFTFLNTPSLTNIPSVRIDKEEYFDYNDDNYKAFRNLNTQVQFFADTEPIRNPGAIWVYDNSYYFYFGLNKGKTALSKMKRKYFSKCTPESDIDFFVIATDITSDLSSSGSGAITIQASGGIGPYTFYWNGPTVDSLTYPITNLFTNEDNPTNTITDIYSGTYTVTVTDSVGNVTDGTFIIPGPPSTFCNTQKTDLTANGSTDGEITVDISNGLSPYTMTVYNYDPSLGGGTSLTAVGPPTTSNATSRIVTNLSKGYYKVIVTDSSIPQTGCDSIVEIIEPQALNIVLNPNDVYCNGEQNGSITTYISGGIGPYELKWNNGETTSIIDGLPADTYSLEVTDAGNGIKTTVSATVKEPLEITHDPIIIVDGNCQGSVASISVNNIGGGSGGPYTTNVSYMSLTGADVTFDNGGSGLEQGIGPDAYEVIITDVSGCTKSQLVDVFSPDTHLSVVLNANTSSGIITATVSGGIFNTDTSSGIDTYLYVVEWYEGSSTTPAQGPKTLTASNDVFNLPPSLPQTTDDSGNYINAAPIMYTIKVKDKNGNGCLVTEFVMVMQDYYILD